MVKVGVLVAEGFEEAETSIIVDVLRRAQINCVLIGLQKIVRGAHDIEIECDTVIDRIDGLYDMFVLPGGNKGVHNLSKCKEVSTLLKAATLNDSFVAAMFAAPLVLNKEHLLEKKRFTAYKCYDELSSAGGFCNDAVVVDRLLITGRGPAIAYDFAYTLVDILGYDSLSLKKRMLYFNAFNVEGTV